MRAPVLIASLVMALAAPASAQRAARRELPAPQTADSGPITPGEVQRMFAAWTLVQAQDALSLSEAQYGGFVAKLKALQDVRRRHQQARAQLLGDLRRALTDPTPAESVLRDKLTALREEDDRAAADLRKAVDDLDEVLDVRQRARFRLFEERMEARKLELILKARQNARQGRGK